MILEIPPFHDAGNTVLGLSQAASPCNVLSKWKAAKTGRYAGAERQDSAKIGNAADVMVPPHTQQHMRQHYSYQFISLSRCICPLVSCNIPSSNSNKPHPYASVASMSTSSSGATWGTVMCAVPVAPCAALKSPTTSIACGLRAHERRATPLITSHSIAD